MKVWVFVEGQSDLIALNTLWAQWRQSLSKTGWGIQVVPLDNKSCFLRKIGPRAAEKLADNADDLAVGLPDLYPSQGFESTEYAHDDIDGLRNVQLRHVRQSLSTIYGFSRGQIRAALDRFCPAAFKYDAEMLLLAAKNELRSFLGTSDQLGGWQHPVEGQNQTRPPKRIVEDLFRSRLGRCYRDTVHTKAVLERVIKIADLLYDNAGQLQCPVFKGMMDWISTKTGVAPY
jgi:hypothetical protein